VTILHPEMQKNISTGIFFTLLDVEDRDWVTVRYALEAKLGADVPNVSAFLKSLQQEGLLFRDDVSTTFDHFIPFTFNPMKASDTEKDIFPAPPSLDDLNLSEKQFTMLMTVLSQLQNQEVTETAMNQYLQGLGYIDVKDDWVHLCKLPYFKLIRNGNDQILSLSSEGQLYYNRIDSLIHQLPPPISLDSQTIDNTLHELRHLIEESSRNDAMEQHQLKKLIEEVAGAFLNEYLQIQEAVDWYLVRKYVNLLEIEGIHSHHHTKRLELLEMLYTEIQTKTKTKIFG
jgi:hypothetical protein